MYFNKPAKLQHTPKIYYVEEVMSCPKHTFQNARSDSSFQSIDESMTKFKGRSSLKEFLPLEPVKTGTIGDIRTSKCHLINSQHMSKGKWGEFDIKSNEDVIVVAKWHALILQKLRNCVSIMLGSYIGCKVLPSTICLFTGGSSIAVLEDNQRKFFINSKPCQYRYSYYDLIDHLIIT
nr:unnamed protein product [Callosobruchus analis]